MARRPDDTDAQWTREALLFEVRRLTGQKNRLLKTVRRLVTTARGKLDDFEGQQALINARHSGRLLLTELEREDNTNAGEYHND
jgi:hypothetical protein